jgi:hypothetical protein
MEKNRDYFLGAAAMEQLVGRHDTQHNDTQHNVTRQWNSERTLKKCKLLF